MKLKLLLFLPLLLIGFGSLAQNSYFAIKGGYNLSSLHSSDDPSPSLSTRPAFSISGVFAEQFDYIGFSTELGYTRKGTKVNQDTLDYKFNYATGALLLDIYPLDWLKISVGPEFGYLLGATNYATDSTSQNLLNTYDQRFEVSGTIGASVSVLYFLDLGVRYNRSFTTVSQYDAILNRKDLYNSYLQFFVLLKIAN
ncbi:hypothetical protein BFP72_03400 [Reichenbachiella sp. 5M10]|uniref:outer membrane beta-barrel protein n=1 Tax=Reichenbachiella sp. 5M10 TaxID=1889772 RepID=UPI000C15CA91|nr:outer membrane beta-barrel protein [Reichenbachiella sp. 5M10]PIB34522.1 hypothetical protein BFP72_03400 [Reichenbachiella sp. 5M10]